MIWAMWAALAVLSVAVVLGLVVVARSTDGASRAVVGDLVFFVGIGVLVILGTLRDSRGVLDAALFASLIGILTTIALARILTRGRR